MAVTIRSASSGTHSTCHLKAYRIVVRGSAWRAAIWTSRKSTPASSMVATGVTGHVRVRPGDLDAGCLGEVARAAGGRVLVHPGATGVQQDRPEHGHQHEVARVIR